MATEKGGSQQREAGTWEAVATTVAQAMADNSRHSPGFIAKNHRLDVRVLCGPF